MDIISNSFRIEGYPVIIRFKTYASEDINPTPKPVLKVIQL